MTPQEQHIQRIKSALVAKNSLSKLYKVIICDFDKTALMVHCTEKQFYKISAEYKCSGHYSSVSKAAILTNFGMCK